MSDDEYFLRAKRLAEKFDGSPLGQYVRANMGHPVSVEDMEKYLASRMGEEVVKKIELRCTGAGKGYVNEFWISLPKNINEPGSISDLVSGAGDVAKFKGNCAKEIYIEAPGAE